jgi:hydroxymethylpyrimidine/phosphomethylpyrimidine kinase
VTVAKGRVLIVAGSDSGGGAGIQADLKTVTVLGGYGMTAITALTAQNTLGVFGIYPVSAQFVGQQMRVALEDIGADAIKIGMLGSAAVAAAVADILESAEFKDLPVVLDPVLTSTSGHALLDADGVGVLRQRLIPRATLVTPNLAEAEILTGIAAHDLDAMRHAAAAMLSLGARNVLVKGGHLDSDALTDLLATPEGETVYRHARIETRGTHGTGCTLASAIAAGIALGLPLSRAVAEACAYVQAAIRAAPGLGRGNGPLGTPAR